MVKSCWCGRDHTPEEHIRLGMEWASEVLKRSPELRERVQAMVPNPSVLLEALEKVKRREARNERRRLRRKK